MTALDIVRLAALAVAAPSIGCTEQIKPPCVLEVATYTSSAERVSAKITSLGVAGLPGNLLDMNDDLRDALSRDAQGKWYLDIVVEKENVFFPRELADLLAPIRIVVNRERGGSATTAVVLTHCRQRASLFVDIDQVQDDSRFLSFVKGKLVGCRLTGDWWLRGAPLFQGGVYAYLEGSLDADDGTFWLPAAEPVRHLLILGRGQEPIFTTAVDVSLGPSGMAQDIELGDLDIGPSCPPELRADTPQ